MAPGVSATQHHFIRVRQLVPAEQEIVTIAADAPVGEALTLMADRGFDQVPVTNGTTVVGVFSYRSLALNLGVVRRQDDPLTYPVGDFLEELRFVRPMSDVEEILPALISQGAVLVGDDDNLLALVTATDLGDILWHTSKQFMILREIELAMRYLVRSACESEQELRTCLAEAAPPGVAPPTSLEELTFGELIGVVNHPARFGRTFTRTFGGSRELMFATLDPVREARNKVFHFRGEVTPDESALVMAARVWLHRRVRMVL